MKQKTGERWKERDFQELALGDPFRIGSGENMFVQQEWRRAIREIRRTLDLRNSGSDEDADEQTSSLLSSQSKRGKKSKKQ